MSDERIPMVITYDDLEPLARSRLHALSEGDRVLGPSGETAAQVVYDQLPRIVARRLQRITPVDFVLSEIECRFRLEGTVPGLAVNGEVTAKFRRGGEGL